MDRFVRIGVTLFALAVLVRIAIEALVGGAIRAPHVGLLAGLLLFLFALGLLARGVGALRGDGRHRGRGERDRLTVRRRAPLTPPGEEPAAPAPPPEDAEDPAINVEPHDINAEPPEEED